MSEQQHFQQCSRACEETMDKDRGQEKFKSKGFRDSLMSTKGLLFDPWHSTPIKKHTEEISMARRVANSIHRSSANQKSSLSAMQRSQMQTSDLELTIIQKQRTELQLLVAELKDREQELNSMAASHQKQLQAWEQDRQKVLTLDADVDREQRCIHELHRRNKAIRAVARRLKSSEVREQDSRKELSRVQQQMQELSQRQQYSIQQHQDLEDKNRSLNSSLLSLSSQLGQLQAHEEELNSLIKIKDAVLTETTNRIARLSSQLQESESMLKEYQSNESKRLQEIEEYKGRLREARQQNTQLKDELREKHLEINSQREELINLRQENQLLRKELALADTTREALMQYESQRSIASEDTVARASCALEHSNDPETEIDESIEESPSATLKVCDLKKDAPIATIASGQCGDMKTQRLSRRALVSGSDGRSAELAPRVPRCRKRSNAPAENKEKDCCSSESEMDVIVVIDHIADLDDQLVVMDVNSKNPTQSSRSGDVTCVYVDCSGASPQMRTINHGLAEDAVVIQQQEAFNSSTSRLQRLLAESQQMVASLEPINCSEKGCDSVCSPNCGRINIKSCEQVQYPENSLEVKQAIKDGFQIHSINSLQKTTECAQ
ncbi:Coiled-coil domain-containing protein 62 [Bagarius yarrelli]|uniref:Coiled-coil domain-containing protein 62 n=1 Tax=Bagarius yarrelli TaxID=175774 RepID=A0A556U387_BAGYA|nr:Coiled-coil domain-containing protein 62 [Bagarius yarrelli]